jgi:acetoacetyl-CoA synthetase
MSGEALREGTARLFRSVRAGRTWLREAALVGEAPAVPGCITLKQGDAGLPVFMIPGAPGSVLQLAPVASELTVPLSVYAVKPRGFEEGEIPFERLEDMADYNIGVIKSVHPGGPYVLVGYSVGGLIALEMARRLLDAGHQVRLVVLLATYPSRRVWPVRCHLGILARQTGRSIRTLRRISPSGAARWLADRTRSLGWYLHECGVRWLPVPPMVPEGVSPASRRLHLASVNAGETYRPKLYGGKVVFLQPKQLTNLEPRAPGQVWRRFLTNFEVRRVAGSHLTMVECDAASTAAELSRCLAEAG